MPVYVSDKLTATLGVVRGSPTPTRLIQWFRGSTVISGANASTYTITSDDLGQPISVRQTESNYFGSAVATSAATEDVQVFSPSILFSASEPGVWFDPTDAANLAWRRNLLLQTEAFDNAYWAKNAATLTANADVAPNGATTADLMYPTSTGLWRGVYVTGVAAANTQYTLTVYAKAAGLNHVAIGFDNGTSPMAWFNLSTGSLGTKGAAITSYAITSVGSGWYRCAVTFTHTAPAYAYISMSDADNSGTSTTSGTNGVLIWGAQLEVGSTATTYQPITDLNTEVIAQFPNATLYQDAAGTIPVYAPEQPVGLMLDKSKGLVLGPELVTNGTFTTGIAGWTPGYLSPTLSWDEPNQRIALTGGSFATATTSFSVTAGKTYRLSATLAGAVPSIWFGTSSTDLAGVFVDASGQTIYTATATGTLFVVIQNRGANGATVYFDNISVKELPGNHATQSTAISRPLYGIVPVSGRRNLFVQTEAFGTSPWAVNEASISANTTAAPDGTTTADKLVEANTNALHFLSQTVTVSAGANTFSAYLKAGERQFAFLYHGLTNTGFSVNLATGATGLPASSVAPVASSVTLVGDGWYRVSMTVTATAGAQFFRVYLSDTLTGGGAYTGNGTSGLFVWGAQVEAGSLMTAYQKVTTDYDVTEVGVASVGYLRFDGSNDWMVTSTITPGTDKVQVFSGVRKLNSLTGVIAELSAIVSNAGSFLLYNHPDNAIKFGSRGSAALVEISGAASVPSTKVVTGLGDISGDTTTLRFDGVQVATSTADQGTGNFLAYPLYLGRRGGTTLEFNGQLFPLIIRFGPNMSSALIRTTENWVASKTAGVTLP